ncbi:hypothetical protein MF672_017130 [Actinomadura sp. ATCC 31491]|uniref:Uncharacterized protein n=1 Tax=Actinomadura luzonensis TaxID=2805427 RepID=A0ABT0FT57_9ACTN|nr:hypothetical protein [Actinomadura luzonensis]MCK2215497.1 hypothetical protein [Actinomadura luzonensis]
MPHPDPTTAPTTDTGPATGAGPALVDNEHVKGEWTSEAVYTILETERTDGR